MKRQITDILTGIRPEFDFSTVGVDVLPENFASVEKIEALLRKNGAK